MSTSELLKVGLKLAGNKADDILKGTAKGLSKIDDVAKTLVKDEKWIKMAAEEDFPRFVKLTRNWQPVDNKITLLKNKKGAVAMFVNKATPKGEKVAKFFDVKTGQWRNDIFATKINGEWKISRKGKSNPPPHINPEPTKPKIEPEVKPKPEPEAPKTEIPKEVKEKDKKAIWEWLKKHKKGVGIGTGAGVGGIGLGVILTDKSGEEK